MAAVVVMAVVKVRNMEGGLSWKWGTRTTMNTSYTQANPDVNTPQQDATRNGDAPLKQGHALAMVRP